jgi:hypothetical protein
MKIGVFLSKQNEWFLSVKMVCLDHYNHPQIDLKAISLSRNDILDTQIKLGNTLYDVNVSLFKIAQILGNLKDNDRGTFFLKQSSMSTRRAKIFFMLLMVFFQIVQL